MPRSLYLHPLGTRQAATLAVLECFSCGALVPKLAEFVNERQELVRVCDECEDDVLDEIDRRFEAAG